MIEKKMLFKSLYFFKIVIHYITQFAKLQICVQRLSFEQIAAYPNLMNGQIL